MYHHMLTFFFTLMLQASFLFMYCYWYKGNTKELYFNLVQFSSHQEEEGMLYEKVKKHPVPPAESLLSSICNNSIRFFQCSGCFDIDTLSRFKCGYFKAQPVSSVWKSPIIILSISVSSHCSHSDTLTSANAYMHTNTHSHTQLVSLQCQWF